MNLKGESVIYKGMSQEMVERTLDDSVLPTIADSSKDCFVGVKFPASYIGIVNEISFFLDEFDRETVVDHLFIQGSADNFVTSETLVSVSQEVHEGWNYYDLSSINHEFQ